MHSDSGGRRFAMPGPPKPRVRIWPVFLPFYGCMHRCIYCAQDLQTGVHPLSLHEHYSNLRQALKTALAEDTPAMQLGFFGGTFTALSQDWQYRFISLAQEFKAQGLLTKIRCSTRPDAISAEQLQFLHRWGLDMVELGIQSFSSRVLTAARRTYSSQQAKHASELVLNSGLELGLQLMPGLPEHNSKKWLQDIQTVCELRPHQVRIYPCLVLKGTPLEKVWNKKLFAPWSLEKTVPLLARAVLKLWKHTIPVTRIGLPQEKSLLQSIKAGPWHPGLGDLVQSRILFYMLKTQSILLGPGPKKLFCPQKYQGQLWGFGKCYLPQLQALGISRQQTFYHQDTDFVLLKSSQ